MLFKRLAQRATLPIRGTKHSAGYDLACINDVALAPHSRQLVDTGIGWESTKDMEIEQEYIYGRIEPRSGLAVRDGIDVLAGVIDADYRGEIKVALINHSDHVVSFRAGDRIAQLVINTYYRTVDDHVSEVIRGKGGYGSTGK